MIIHLNYRHFKFSEPCSTVCLYAQGYTNIKDLTHIQFFLGYSNIWLLIPGGGGTWVFRGVHTFVIKI